MEWMIYRVNPMSDEIDEVNIFKHGTFKKECARICKDKSLDREEFDKQIISELRYYFWSKIEWEIWIKGCFSSKERKVDAFSQIMINKDKFLDYVWNNRQILAKEKC